MSSNKQSTMVNHTLHELLHRNSSTKITNKPMILALLTSHIVGTVQGLQFVKKISNQDVFVQFSADDSLLAQYSLLQLVDIIENDHWLSSTKLQEIHHLNQVDIIFIPIFSFSLAANLLLFNDQNSFVRLILKALLSGKKVVGLKTGIDPYHPIWTVQELDRATHFLKRKMSNQMRDLSSIGIQLINDEESPLSSECENKAKSVITEKTIRYYHQQKYKELFISNETIITPLALDMAKELAITLIKK